MFWETETLAEQPSPNIQFNYLGQFDNMFTGSEIFEPAAEPPGAFSRVAGPSQTRPYLLEIMGIVVKEELRFMWLYSNAMHRTESVEKFAGEFMARLREIINHCCGKEGTELTVSDFPLASLTEDKFAKIAAKLGKSKKTAGAAG